jgi:hypothetical protein
VKRVLLLMALTISLTGCATGHVVTARDGYPAIFIECNGRRMDKCYRRAERMCPMGYHMLEQPYYGQLLIRCN